MVFDLIIPQKLFIDLASTKTCHLLFLQKNLIVNQSFLCVYNSIWWFQSSTRLKNVEICLDMFLFSTHFEFFFDCSDIVDNFVR